MKLDHEIDIRVDDPAWNVIGDLAIITSKAIRAVLSSSDQVQNPCGVTIIFSDNMQVKKLNNSWRGKDKPTNILSFPAPQNQKTELGNIYLGDLIIAFQVVGDEARQQGKTLKTHLCHLIIHGTLHLLGFDHQDDVTAMEMETLEISTMAKLGYGNPYEAARANLPETNRS